MDWMDRKVDWQPMDDGALLCPFWKRTQGVSGTDGGGFVVGVDGRG